MANDFKILLQAVLDSSGIGKSDIAEVQKVLDKYHLNLSADLNKAELLKTVKQVVPELEKELKKITGVDVKISDDVLLKSIHQIDKEIERINKTQLNINTEKYSTEIKKIESQVKNFSSLSGKEFKEVEASVKNLNSAYKNMQNVFSSATGKNANSDKIKAEEQYHEALLKTKNLISQLNLNKDNQIVHVGDEKRVNMINTLNNYLAKNTAMTKESKKEILKWIDTLASSDDLTIGSIKNINTEFKTLDATLRSTGKLGLSWTDKFKQTWEKFGGWSIATGMLTKGAFEIREAIGELKELDNILTEISKTSDLTTSQLKKLGDTAFDTASKYGKKASDYLTGVQEMYRAGFDNAEQMAELSVLAQSAGDMDATAANNYLMATNAAYKYKGSVEELNNVLDGQNYITNNAAISMKDISDATSETASVAAQYGVQIDELSALIATATANTRESGSEVGTALKAILINLQDTTSKPVTDTLDKLNISMFKLVDGSQRLKTPIELIHELAKAYNSLPEGHEDRALILNEIGQKRHANTLASILSDMEGYQSMLDLYNNTSADGSALREAEKSANNLTGSLNKLSNTWTDTVENILDSDTLKTGVNILNGLLTGVNNLTDALGGLGSIGLGAGLIAGIKNVGINMLVAYLSNLLF